ncbi:MAG: tetratricopeptide repeat protein, partial [Promethearchaeota archaeon]
MFHSETEELTLARKFIIEGKYEEALQLLKDFEERRNNSLEDIVSCHLVKCFLLLTQGLPEEFLKFAEQTYNESLDLENSILSVDALIFMANGFNQMFNLEQANKTIKQAEDLLATLKNELEIDKTQRKALINLQKGMISSPIFISKGDVELALKYLNYSLALGESLGDDRLVCVNLIQIAWLLGLQKGEFDHALEYVERGLTVAKEINYKLFISVALLQKATFYHNKGEVIRSFPLYEQSLEIAKELNHKRMIASIFNNMADAYRLNGELDNALKCILKSQAQSYEIGSLPRIINSHDYLIQILIEKGDLDQAQQYLTRLEQLIQNKKLEEKWINLMYLYNKALILKQSSRISNKGKAVEMLKQILENEDIDRELNERAIPTLCELLLFEFQVTNEVEVLDELESLIARLIEIAEKSRSYWILCETYLLQAKLTL